MDLRLGRRIALFFGLPGWTRIDRRLFHRPDQGAASRAPWTPRARRGVLADNAAVVACLADSAVGSLGFGCGRPPLDSPGSASRRAKSLAGHSHHRSTLLRFASRLRRWLPTAAPQRARREPQASQGVPRGTLPQPRQRGREGRGVRRTATATVAVRTSPWHLGSSRGMGNGPSKPVGGAGAGQPGPTGKSGRTDDGARPRRDGETRSWSTRGHRRQRKKGRRSRPRRDEEVNPGPPERTEERTIGPDHEGTLTSSEGRPPLTRRRRTRRRA